MDAVLNISLLGGAASPGRSRTGVYTYTRWLARKFLGDVDIGFALQAGGWLDFVSQADARDFGAQVVPRVALKLAETVAAMPLPKRGVWMEPLDKWLSGWEPSGTGRKVFHQPWFGKWPQWSAKSGWTRCLTVHDLIAWRHPEWFDERTAGHRERWSRWIRDADCLICDSEATRTDLLDVFSGISPDRTAVVPLGPSFSFETLEVNDSLLPQALRGRSYFLSVCTIEPRKNLRRLLQAFARFKDETGSDCLMVLVGGGGWLESLPEMLASVGKHRDAVLPTGYLPDEVLPTLYRGATGFVYPSLYEGFGLPVLDAMTVGVPVITSRVSSLPEITGEAAILVEPTDVEDIADALARVEGDLALRERLARQGRERSRLFGWERCARETKAVYASAIGAD